MTKERKRLYPPNWKQLAAACKERAGYRCEACHVQQGRRRRSRRTGKLYPVYLHAAHMHFNDTMNTSPDLRCLCPRCHGRYDYWRRLMTTWLVLEQFRHRALLAARVEARSGKELSAMKQSTWLNRDASFTKGTYCYQVGAHQWQATTAPNYRRCAQPGCKAAQRLDNDEWVTVFPNSAKGQAGVSQKPALLEVRTDDRHEKGARVYEAR
jgi:hypothetical protein